MYCSVRTRVLNLTTSIYYSCWIICYCCMETLETTVCLPQPLLLCSVFLEAAEEMTHSVCRWLRWDKIVFLLLCWVCSKGSKLMHELLLGAKPAHPLSHFNVPFETPCAQVWAKTFIRFCFMSDLIPLLCVTHSLKHCWHCKGVWRLMKIQAIIFQRHMHPYPCLPLELETKL